MKRFLACGPRPALALVLLLLQIGCRNSPRNLPRPTVMSSSSAPAPAGSPAAPADVEAMLTAVVQHYGAVGREQALKDFTDQVSPFNSDNVFVLCIGPDDKITALGGDPLFVGLSADQLSDNTGQFGHLVWLLASAGPKGSLPFVWVDPMSEQQSPKRMYYQRLSQDVCGVVADQ